MILRRHRGIVPRRRRDLLALPGVGPALVEILLNVFDNWGPDEVASPEAGRITGGCSDGCVGGGSGGVDGSGGGGEGVGSDGGGGGGGIGSGGNGDDRLSAGGERRRSQERIRTEDDEPREVHSRHTGVDIDNDGVAVTKVVPPASAKIPGHEK